MRTALYLGLTNSIRNIGRSLLTVVAMALAAFMMTSSLTVGEGYTPGRAAEYRAYLGGDVLVYPTWTWPTEADVANLKAGEARLAALPASFGSPLRYFHPDYYARGYLTTAPEVPAYSMFPDAGAQEQAVEAVKATAGVTGVVPYEAVPVMSGGLDLFNATGQGASVAQASLSGFYVRECPPNLLGDADPAGLPRELRLVDGTANPPDTITVITGSGGQTLADVMDWKMGVVPSGGRTVAGTDGDALVAMINRRAVIPRADLGAKSVVLPGPGGQTVKLTLPRIVARGGSYYYDFADPVTVDIRVVGTYDVLSRLYQWMPAKDVHIFEQLYLEAPELLMPPGGFDKLLAVMGLPPGAPPPVGALAVRLADQSKTEETVGLLRQALPGLSVVSVAQETAFANAHGQPERVYMAPAGDRPRPLPARQPSVPAESGNIFGLLLFGFAGLVAAGNTTLVVLNRRMEFAILKAIGLRGFEVALMVVAEVLTLSIIGLLIGFAAGETSALPVILTNGVPLGTVATQLGRDFGIVAAATLGCAVIFSVVPMSKTLRITVSEAMRGNE